MSIWYLILPAAAFGAKLLSDKKEKEDAAIVEKAVPIATRQVAQGVPMKEAVSNAAQIVSVAPGKVPIATPLPAPIRPSPAPAVISKAQAYENAVKIQYMMERGIQNQPLPVVPWYSLSESDLPKATQGWAWKMVTIEGPQGGKFWTYSTTMNFQDVLSKIVKA